MSSTASFSHWMPRTVAYRKEKMEEIEWTMRETFYRVGEAMHVEVVKVKRKGKSGWNIEVKSVD